MESFSRSELLIGEQAVQKLKNARIAIFGVGGVGGYCVEALARTGVGHFDLIDMDTISESNINRQIIATTKTVGKDKVDVMKERILDINPEADVQIYKTFFLPENSNSFPFDQYDYVVDAVDTVSAKIELVMKCKEVNVPIICSMGAGNKLDPTQFKVADIYKTKMCPLAKVMRHEMKKRHVKHLKVVYSEEIPIKPKEILKGENGKIIPGSISFVPGAAGLILAGEVIKDLIYEN